MRRVLPRLAWLLALPVGLGMPLSGHAQATTPEQLREIEARVASLRRLEPRTEVVVAVMEPGAFRAHLLLRPEDTAEREFHEQLSRVLGRPPAEVEVLGEAILAVYEPEAGRVALPEGELDAHAKYVLAHEITHALQDQHFDLGGLAGREPRNSDRELALRALAEGDASLTARIYATLSLGADELRSLNELAQHFGSPLLYRLGEDFVQELLADGGWEALNAAYADPPDSTEQVVHPRKYALRERPTPLALGDAAAALGGAWRLLREDSLGELEARSVLGRFLPPFMAIQAAAGWGGDRYQLLERASDGRLALVLRTAWDTPRDAEELLLPPRRWRPATAWARCR